MNLMFLFVVIATVFFGYSAITWPNSGMNVLIKIGLVAMTFVGLILTIRYFL